VTAVALEVMRGEFFTSMLDEAYLMSLSNIITTPNTKIDPAARLIYYNLVFQGCVIGDCQSPLAARALYLQCLQAVSAWQETATGTMMDLIGACIMQWTCVLSFDYRLAYRFHTQSCKFAKQMGLQHLDVLASKGTKEAELQHHQRMGFWHLVLCDLFFRLCYGRESSISADASPNFVHFPEMLDLKTSRPMAGVMIPHMIWGRVTVIAKEFYDQYDRIRDDPAQISGHAFQAKVDSICDEIEGMINDWDLVRVPNHHLRILIYHHR
jgi:hypothetical protein